MVAVDASVLAVAVDESSLAMLVSDDDDDDVESVLVAEPLPLAAAVPLAALSRAALHTDAVELDDVEEVEMVEFVSLVVVVVAEFPGANSLK